MWIYTVCSVPILRFHIETAQKILTEMTFPRADNDLLILAPSFNLSPVAPVLSARSDPAKQFTNAISDKKAIGVDYTVTSDIWK